MSGSTVDRLINSALALVARRKVMRRARGGQWIVPAGGRWCQEMGALLDALLDRELIYLAPNTGGLARLTELGEQVLRDALPRALHVYVFPPPRTR